MGKEFIVQEGKIIISPDRKDAKPITGTKLGGITGDNPYQTPFLIFMDLYRFAIPFEMNVPVKIGMALEDTIVEKVNQTTGMSFGNYEKTSSGFMSKFYDWNLESGPGRFFNGLIDGWDKEKKIVLECKISNQKNDKRDEYKATGVNLPMKFAQHPPIYYLLQMMLYGQLSEATEIWLSAYFVNDADLAGVTLDTPDVSIVNNFKFDESRLVIWKYKMDDALKAKAKVKLDIAKDFLNTHINQRVSPVANAAMKCDVELIKCMYEKGELDFDEVTDLLKLNSPSIRDIFANASEKWAANNLRKHDDAIAKLDQNKMAMFDALCKLHWL